MTLLEVATALSTLVAGIGAGIGAMHLQSRRRAARNSESTPAPPQPDPLCDTGRFAAATGLGGMRCDRHQSLEDGHTALLIEVRTGFATMGQRLGTIDGRLDGQHEALAEIRESTRRPSKTGVPRP